MALPKLKHEKVFAVVEVKVAYTTRRERQLILAHFKRELNLSLGHNEAHAKTGRVVIKEKL